MNIIVANHRSFYFLLFAIIFFVASFQSSFADQTEPTSTVIQHDQTTVGSASSGAVPNSLSKSTVLKVGVVEGAPFAMMSEQGDWEGLSIELIDHISKDLGYEYILEKTTESEGLKEVDSGKFDIIAGDTPLRQELLISDYTIPYFVTGLSIAVSKVDEKFYSVLKDHLVSKKFMEPLGLLFVLCLCFSLLLWAVERKANPSFQGGSLRGIGEGLWWTFVTMVTIGDEAPKTIYGRLIAVAWMISTVVILSSLVGTVAGALTTHALRPEVYGPSDLSRVEVGTIAGGIGAKYLDKRHLNYQTFKTVPAALDSLESGKLKAIVFSEPVLRYQVKKNYAKTLKVLPNSFTSQYYVLITSKNSLLRLALNKAVFNMSYSEEWLDILHKYMGHVPSHH